MKVPSLPENLRTSETSVWFAITFAFVLFLSIYTLVFGKMANTFLLNSSEVKLAEDGWYYKLEDSEMNAGTISKWSKDPSAWKGLGSTSHLPSSKKVYWIAHALPDALPSNPMMVIKNSTVQFEIFVGDDLLYRSYGHSLNSKFARKERSGWHFIYLPQTVKRENLYFRIMGSQGAHSLGSVYFSSKSAALYEIIKVSLPIYGIGGLVLLFAFIIILQNYIIFKKLRNVFLALFIANTGLFFLVTSPARQLLFDNQVVWEAFELLILTLLPYTFTLFNLRVKSLQGQATMLYIRVSMLFEAFLAALGIFFRLFPLEYALWFCFFISANLLFFSLITTGKEQRLAPQNKIEIALSLSLVLLMFAYEAFSLNYSEAGFYSTLYVATFPCIPLFALVFYVHFHFGKDYANITQQKEMQNKVHALTLFLLKVSNEGDLACAFVEFLHKELALDNNFFASIYLKCQNIEEPAFTYMNIASLGKVGRQNVFHPLNSQKEAFIEEVFVFNVPTVVNKKNLIIPIVSARRKRGFFLIESGIVGFLSMKKLVLLRHFAEIVGLMLDNIDNIKNIEQAASESIEQQAIQTVQKFLLPKVIELPYSQVAANYIAAPKTGGGWFGYYFNERSKTVTFVLGDVTGHGVSSAIIAGVASGAVHASQHILTAFDSIHTMSEEDKIVLFVKTINEIIFESGKEELFMTMLTVSINLETGEGFLANAGHHPFYWIQAASNRITHVMKNPTTALGYSATSNFKIEHFQLEKGDVLFFYSAGLVGNRGPTNRKLGAKKIKSLLTYSRDPVELQNLILTAAKEVWKNEAAENDVTTIVLKWQGPEWSDFTNSLLGSRTEEACS